MITLIHNPQDSFAAEIVYKALIRSFAKNQVRKTTFDTIQTQELGVYFLINPKNISLQQFPKKSKIILLGKIDADLAVELDIELSSSEKPHDYFTENAIIHFHSIDQFQFPMTARPFIRYDFPNEWNNLGFGAIKTDDSIWSIAQIAQSHTAIATISENKTTSVYITFHDFSDQSCVWINRPVGLVDSVNWCFIEYFVSAHRFDTLISYAYLLDIPAGVNAAVSMRLDCDEDILSAKPLFEAYQNLNVPFSLAIKTSLPTTELDKDFLHCIKNSGGAILSHSVNHKVSWGIDYHDAFTEAQQSKITLENHFEIVPLQFAVSPFHSNTTYSVNALEDAGYDGFIGGIIANDPEYLMARGGAIPFAEKIISHSQQCMLHGDCLLSESDPLRIYKKAFDHAYTSKTFFGYLDHPFSPRYQYGWITEEQRITAHIDFIQYMRSCTDVLFVNESQCLQFMIDKSNAEIHYDALNEPKMCLNAEKQSEFSVAVSLNHKVFS